jgi:hypothetical protein
MSFIRRFKFQISTITKHLYYLVWDMSNAVDLHIPFIVLLIQNQAEIRVLKQSNIQRRSHLHLPS